MHPQFSCLLLISAADSLKLWCVLQRLQVWMQSVQLEREQGLYQQAFRAGRTLRTHAKVGILVLVRDSELLGLGARSNHLR